MGGGEETEEAEEARLCEGRRRGKGKEDREACGVKGDLLRRES